MKPLRTFVVAPALPAELEGLREIALNLRWAWNHDAIELFRRLGFDLWEEGGHNPLLVLGRVPQETLLQAARDDGFMAHYQRVLEDLREYLASGQTWYRKVFGETDSADDGRPIIAYFSAEFGVTECLPIYSGGLGILAGDHLKSASELGLPLVGVGLLYQQGYFRQQLNADGWQQELYPVNDFYHMPIELVRENGDGKALEIAVEYPGRTVRAQIWRAQVGRISLYLLDANVPSNARADQDITDQLYGGGTEMRIRQEILLGIGGVRALAALGIEPIVCHMNEGHSAFLALERIRTIMRAGKLSFAEAREVAAGGQVFTTHTPVAAGHDYFDPGMVETYFAAYARALGLSMTEFLDLGRHGGDQRFCMTALALRLASHSNAVSRLHEQVSRRMWVGLWPGAPEDEVPISHVTNGAHTASWISKEMAALYDRYLGPRWREQPADVEVWKGAEKIPAEELWRTCGVRRERLVAFVRRRLRAQTERQGGSAAEMAAADEVLDPDVLTVGFARRFATYKRANLLLRDPARLSAILAHPERPVQMIFAGKAHPADAAGKEIIRQIVHFARQEEHRFRMVFLEDYDMDVARYMVQGVDVWLNTPRRPREASGTSGMKAAFNGALNLSILDGWWDEAYDPALGWAIGQGEEYADEPLQDEIEANALYYLLERSVAPLFYDRTRNGLPRGWIDCMKESMARLCPVFNMLRAVRDYTERFYMPACVHYRYLARDGFTPARELARWKEGIRSRWSEVRVEEVEPLPETVHQVGDVIDVRARVRLGSLTPKDVDVELYVGTLDGHGEIRGALTHTMLPEGPLSDGRGHFIARNVPCQRSGNHGYTVRVLPSHTDLWSAWELGLVSWAAGE